MITLDITGIDDPELQLFEVSKGFLGLGGSSKVAKGKGHLRLVDIFKNDKYPAIRNVAHTASFLSENSEFLVEIPFEVKFIPQEGTYTKEEWELWEKYRKQWEAGILPPKDDIFLYDGAYNLIDVDVMPPIYYHDTQKGLFVIKTQLRLRNHKELPLKLVV